MAQMTDVKAAIIRIDESIARLDERSKGDRVLTRLIIIPLLLLLVGAMFGLLTKGILWHIQP
ncbi:MAG: hypothetical protein OXU94_02445 [Gammaproteobacteria bacterium]|nr:hypothetical protein [Gammaproteobacteria bacterium]